MAAPNVAISVAGLPELNRLLRQIGDEMAQREVREANKAAAGKIVQRALGRVPVRSGRLKQSVRALATKRSARMLAGGARVPYAQAVHWGTGPRAGLRGPHNIRRNAFLWDARQELAAEVAQEYEAAIDGIIKRLKGGR